MVEAQWIQRREDNEPEVEEIGLFHRLTHQINYNYLYHQWLRNSNSNAGLDWRWETGMDTRAERKWSASHPFQQQRARFSTKMSLETLALTERGLGYQSSMDGKWHRLKREKIWPLEKWSKKRNRRKGASPEHQISWPELSKDFLHALVGEGHTTIACKPAYLGLDRRPIKSHMRRPRHNDTHSGDMTRFSKYWQTVMRRSWSRGG